MLLSSVGQLFDLRFRSNDLLGSDLVVFNERSHGMLDTPTNLLVKRRQNISRSIANRKVVLQASTSGIDQVDLDDIGDVFDKIRGGKIIVQLYGLAITKVFLSKAAQISNNRAM